MDYGEKVNAAGNSHTLPKILTQFAEDEDLWVRCKVAANPNTPKGVLNKLSEDKISLVRQYVAANKNTPVEVLTKFAEDESVWVRSKVKQNPVYLHHRAVQDGICEVGQPLPTEWLKQIYLV